MEIFVGKTNFHFFKTVADVGRVQFVDANGFGVVGLNGDDGDAAVTIIGFQLLDALLVHLGDGTVIAGEDDDQDRAGCVVGEAVDFSIDTGQREVWGG